MPERAQHPTGQDAFRVDVTFPWGTVTRVKLEITHDEPVMLPSVARPIIHGYELLGEAHILEDVRAETYALEEIVTEKLRALRQTQQRLEARGWNRPRARDYYDLWRLLTDFGDALDVQAVRQIIADKMALRDVTYHVLDHFFTEQLVSEARRNWESNLGTFVSPLPDFDEVIAALRPKIASLLALT
jgi:predicted nucleotidyltransferase component of viral defense system